MATKNFDIKKYAKENNVLLWQIAKEMKISDFTLSRKLREELNDDAKKRIISIIDYLSKTKEI